MKAYITSFYTEPRCSLKVSYKVHLQMDKQVNAVLKKYNARKHFSVQDLTVILDSRRINKTRIADVRDLRSPRKRPRLTIFVNLPYTKLGKSRRFLFDYVTLVCDAMTQILHEGGGVSPGELAEMKKKCLREIVGNPKYKYNEEGF